ncbi:TatD family hydrolase [Dolosigranulum savutiense]|uniref:TatD family hydrolase n=1 Tax=Dolosigranulum savutiense TaxID=3110288 RepID=A0AB74TYA5_9LACT
MFFDTHTHINVKQFNEDVEQTIDRAREAGVTRMSVVGFDYPTIERAFDLAAKYEGIYPTIGWHPTEAGSFSDKVEDFLRQALGRQEVVAVGEMGLDYHWMSDPKPVQHEAFRRQIQLAKDVGKPLTIHNRESTEDVYQIMKEVGLPETGGIMHSFGVNTEWLHKFLDLGFHISLSGVVTFKNAPEVKEIAKEVPLERLLIETDAPYLAPEPNRGKRNEPAYVRYVAEEIARLKELSLEEIATQTTQNANRLFKLADQ